MQILKVGITFSPITFSPINKQFELFACTDDLMLF
jgi:hypothetical protein